MESLNILSAIVSQRLSPRSVDDDQWGEVVELALHHDLAPMLYWVLKGGGINLESASLLTPLVSAAREAAVNYALLNRTRILVETALKGVCIPTIWLKGIALAHTVYPQPWLRPMADLDVLVPYDQRLSALTMAESLGFHQPQDPVTLSVDIPEDLQHHYFLTGSVANSVQLELHYRLLGVDGLDLLPWEQLNWFWEESYLWTDGKDEIKMLKPEPQLLYLCAHALIQHGEANTSLFRYFDLHLLITKTALDWQIVVDKALELKWSFAVERALKFAIQFFNTPVPPRVLEQLRARRSINEDTFRVTRIQSRGSSWERTLMLLSKLSFPARLRIIFNHIFPPQKHMRERYSVSSDQPILPYYLYRWFYATRELVWSIRHRFLRHIRGCE